MTSMNSPVTPVILCGGGGTRLWPRSRRSLPKPFLPLVGGTTLFQQTLSRTGAPEHFTPPLIVAGADHVGHIEAQLGEASAARIIVEPAAKNTAAAIALAALALPAEAVMLVCPSDHHIADVPAFVAAGRAAANLAGEGWLVTFGIAPTGPETGFGYIKAGEALEGGFRVARFVEKPSEAVARGFLAEGGYSWNGGIFAFRAGDFLAELAAHRPALHGAVAASVAAGAWDTHRFAPGAGEFAQIEGESVDYAVMEPTARAAMVPVSMGWSDIGNWAALHDARATDAAGSSVTGTADLIDCARVLVESDGPRVSVVGLSDVIVVVDGNEVLVTSRAGAQAVGKLPGATNQ